MAYLANGLAQAQSGPFGSKVFYVEPVQDVLNRIQFRVLTWQGSEDEDGGGGWWHFDSIVQDSDGIKVFTEVTYGGAELALEIPWPDLDGALDEQRLEELYDEATAWKWVSAALAKHLDLNTLDDGQIEIPDEVFRRELEKRGVAKLLN